MAKKVKVKKPHPIRHSIFLVLSCLFMALGVAVTTVANSMHNLLNTFAGSINTNVDDATKATTLEAGADLAVETEAESAVLLQNNDGVLPLSADVKQVNVFGWASTQWIGGGSGSGGVSSVSVDLLQALTDHGIAYNTELTDMYRDFCAGREYTSTLNSWPAQSSRLYEPDIANTTYYTESMLDNAKAYSDTAIVVLGRLAGESSDATKKQYKRVEKDGEIVTDDTRTYLDLSTEEEALLTYVGENYENVIVLLNTGNVMTVGQIETIPGVDACLAVGLSGKNGASAIPELLWGDTAPSGRTADTWAYDFSTAASYANSGEGGVGSYSNADGLYPMDGTTTMGNLGEQGVLYDQVSYVDYAEGIYIGYKWYETADAESFWANVNNEYGTGYDGVVQYPFGYGLSYTTFDWEVTDSSVDSSTLTKDGTVSVTVKVTNTGDAAGKDVVELYYTAPYTKGEIEKSSVELGAFAKTDTLQPGESQEVTLTMDVEDMASYDCYDANHNGFAGYELDAGDYIFTVRHDAHTVDDAEHATLTATLPTNVQYPTDSATGAEVSNKFTGTDAVDGVSLDGSDSEQNITYLTRADFAGTFPKDEAGTREMTDNVKALNLYTSEMADAWIDESDEAITTGAKNGLKIESNGETTELGYQLGANYDDPQWDDLLDQMTLDEMEELVMHGYSHTAGVDSIGKELTKELDGPAQIGGFTSSVSGDIGTGFPSASTLSQSWNTEVARNMGRQIGSEALQHGISGWYAPAVNLHRSPFDGRNYEYYSEDSMISGMMCGNVVAGSHEAGEYCYVKHFICNDGESNIYRDSVYTWMTEQTLRETYLEPFRMIVEDFGATGLMSSYNRIGAVWAGGSEALLTSVLRDEWGFTGAVITDYSDHHVYMNGDQMLRAGGDIWMDGMSGALQFETSSNSYQQALRRASKNILYMYLNARVTNRDYVEQSGDTALTRPVITAGMPIWKIAVCVIDALGVVLVLLSIRALVRDHKLRKAAKATAQKQA